MYAYEQLAIERNLPPFSDPTRPTHTGDDFGNAMEETGCGVPNSSLVAGEDQLSGRYSALARPARLARRRDRRRHPGLHGPRRQRQRRAHRRRWTGSSSAGRAGDKLWIGQWDHGSGCCPNRRGDPVDRRAARLVRQAPAGRDVDTGPPVELFLSDGTFESARAGDRDEMLTGTRCRSATQQLTFFPTPSGGSSDSPETQGGSADLLRATPRGFTDPRTSARRDVLDAGARERPRARRAAEARRSPRR